MQPVLFQTKNEQIVREMQAAGIYDTFQEQMDRVQPGPKQIFVFIDALPQRLTYYIYHRGFILESDNGFTAITILNPAGCPQVVQAIEADVRGLFDSAITTLWVDNPQRRN
jgi:hypothetical protein